MSIRDTSKIWKVLVAGAAMSVVAACGSSVTGSPPGHHDHGAALAAATRGPGADVLHRGRPGAVGLRTRRHQRHHRQAVHGRRAGVHPERTQPDRAQVLEVAVPRLHGRHLHPSDPDTDVVRGDHPGLRRLARHARTGDPGRGGRHHPGRVPQQHAVPGLDPPPRRLLQEDLRGRAVRRRHLGSREGRRRRAARRRPTRTRGRCRNAPAPAPWTARRCCGCTTRTPTRSPTPTPAWSVRWSSPRGGWPTRRPPCRSTSTGRSSPTSPSRTRTTARTSTATCTSWPARRTASRPTTRTPSRRATSCTPSTATSTATARCRPCGWVSGCAGTPSASAPRSTCTPRTGTATR